MSEPDLFSPPPAPLLPDGVMREEFPTSALPYRFNIVAGGKIVRWFGYATHEEREMWIKAYLKDGTLEPELGAK